MENTTILQINADDVVTRLLAENASMKSQITTTVKLLIVILSVTHNISHKQAEKIFNMALKKAESFEQAQILLSLGAYDKEIDDLMNGK